MRVVLLDVSSPAMAEAEPTGKTRPSVHQQGVHHEAWVDRRMSRMSFLRRKEESARALRRMPCTTRSPSSRSLTTASLRGLARVEGRRPAESAGAPAGIPVPPIPGEAQGAPTDDGAGARAPTDVIETSRKRSAEDAGHETDDADRGGVQPDPGSMADDSMQEAMKGAGALGADAVALAEAYSPARFQQRASAFGLQCRRGDGSALGMGSGPRG